MLPAVEDESFPGLLRRQLPPDDLPEHLLLVLGASLDAGKVLVPHPADLALLRPDHVLQFLDTEFAVAQSL